MRILFHGLSEFFNCVLTSVRLQQRLRELVVSFSPLRREPNCRGERLHGGIRFTLLQKCAGKIEPGFSQLRISLDRLAELGFCRCKIPFSGQCDTRSHISEGEVTSQVS